MLSKMVRPGDGVWGDLYQKSLHYCPDNRLHRFTGLHAMDKDRRTWLKSCRRCVQSVVTHWDIEKGQIREFLLTGEANPGTLDNDNRTIDKST